jgi:hypothetical protein
MEKFWFVAGVIGVVAVVIGLIRLGMHLEGREDTRQQKEAFEAKLARMQRDDHATIGKSDRAVIGLYYGLMLCIFGLGFWLLGGFNVL